MLSYLYRWLCHDIFGSTTSKWSLDVHPRASAYQVQHPWRERTGASCLSLKHCVWEERWLECAARATPDSQSHLWKRLWDSTLVNYIVYMYTCTCILYAHLSSSGCCHKVISTFMHHALDNNNNSYNVLLKVNRIGVMNGCMYKTAHCNAMCALQPLWIYSLPIL